MPREGRASERIVEAIETVLVRDFNAEVVSPGFLEDTKTGEQREIDVLLTFNVAHHAYRTCIEVRDRKKKVGSPDVEAFVTKTNDVLAERRVIVSTSGFTAPALKKAAAYNVQCFDLATTEGTPGALPQASLSGVEMPAPVIFASIPSTSRGSRPIDPRTAPGPRCQSNL